MKINYSINNENLEVNSKQDNVNYLLVNKNNYFSQNSINNQTHFQGFYFQTKDWNFAKLIDEIKFDTKSDIINITQKIQNKSNKKIQLEFNNGNKINYDLIKENVLELKLNNNCDFEIILDGKTESDYDNQGRIYELNSDKLNKNITIKYTKYKSNNLNEIDYVLFLRILKLNNKFNKTKINYELINNWISKNYDYDSEREGNKDYYVNNYIKIKNAETKSKFYFICSYDETELNKLTTELIKDLKLDLDHHENFFDNNQIAKINWIKDKRIKFSYLNAIKSFNELTKGKGIIAGYYWFNQFWTRDESISLGAKIELNELNLTKDILNLRSKILENGRVPNRFPYSELDSADGVGWIFTRYLNILEKIDINNLNNTCKKTISDIFTNEELEILKNKLAKAITLLENNYLVDGLFVSDVKETWMDTSPNHIDDRKGARIEIQALILNMYKLAQKLDLDKEINSNKENKLKSKIRNEFLIVNSDNEKILCDGIVNNQKDMSIRPNIFLTHYIYPELFNKDEWETIFEYVLSKLWLDWGGLSTIDINDSRFVNTHTGINNLSYHRGDSWFFINNIAAISMNKINRSKFKNYVDTIIEASSKDILENGIIGSCSEISDANNQTAKGTWSQAWSTSTYIELILNKYNLKQ